MVHNWINADVRYFCSLAYIGIITGNDYSSYVNGGLAEMQYSLLPDGGTNYTDQQNEAQSYHYYYVQELERYYRVTGSSQALALCEGDAVVYAAIADQSASGNARGPFHRRMGHGTRVAISIGTKTPIQQRCPSSTGTRKIHMLNGN